MRQIFIAMHALLMLGILGASLPKVPPSGAVPFRYRYHEILVDARIGGTGPYTFLLDTGTTPSVVDSALSRRLRLRPRGAPASGSDIAGRSTSAYPVTLRDLRIGSLSVRRLDAIVIDLSSIGAQLGLRLAGVLGSNFFDQRVIQIDYPCRRVSVLPDAGLVPFSAQFTETPSGWIVTNDAWANGRRIRATIDTGNSSTPVVSGRGIARLRLGTAAQSGRHTTSISFGGRHSQTEGILQGVRIGKIELGTLKARFLTSDEPFDLNIGNRSLQRYAVTFDYVRGLLTIVPSQACAAHYSNPR